MARVKDTAALHLRRWLVRLIILYESGTYAVCFWEAEKTVLIHILFVVATVVVTVGMPFVFKLPFLASRVDEYDSLDPAMFSGYLDEVSGARNGASKLQSAAGLSPLRTGALPLGSAAKKSGKAGTPANSETGSTGGSKGRSPRARMQFGSPILEAVGSAGKSGSRSGVDSPLAGKRLLSGGTSKSSASVDNATGDGQGDKLSPAPRRRSLLEVPPLKQFHAAASWLIRNVAR